MNPKGVHVNFSSDPIYISEFDKHRKSKFIAYIYTRFNQNIHEKNLI